MRVHYHTFGCKANQYDTERMRQELEARGAVTATDYTQADVCVVNTCTVTNHADADARRFVRRLRRESPDARIVVAGCSAALRAADYRAMDGVEAVVPGHDPVGVAQAVDHVLPCLVQLGIRRSLDRLDMEPVGGEILTRRVGATRGWVKIQDGCDRKCSFCATRLARGASRSRKPDQIIAEARALALSHPELVLTGIHIGHYGRDLDACTTLGGLLARLLDGVPDVRFRLGSIEASEIDDPLLQLLATSGDRVATHLHMPLQSGSDSVLRRMRRWHTRETYRARALEIAARVTPLGLGADVITGFPGETDEDHAQTRALIEEIPFTYLHVFPFSPREGTIAATMPDPVPQRVASERSRELREIAQRRGRAYRESRRGERAVVVLEGGSGTALTEDYLRVRVAGTGNRPAGALHSAVLEGRGDDLFARLTMPTMLR
ncbi:MAG: tRNA (N(6)-L-threonylcarbamoyladenosine(37)-C(2))-methylthiotransferase MtaB [Gemmatimonadota bacterium]|nr:MAG: tRNA (N(6)-L-threonylcarbamoyladenosine(37)-C(2))-methylthiotransferase MtaB [Gemmatimonadota bacterium]